MRRLANTLDKRRSRSRDSVGTRGQVSSDVAVNKGGSRIATPVGTGEYASTKIRRSQSLSASRRQSALTQELSKISQKTTSSRSGDSVSSQSSKSQSSSTSQRKSLFHNLRERNPQNSKQPSLRAAESMMLSVSVPHRQSPLSNAKSRKSQTISSSRKGDTTTAFSQSPRSQSSSTSQRRSPSPMLREKYLQRRSSSSVRNPIVQQNDSSSQSFQFDSFGVLTYTASPKVETRPESARQVQRRESRPVSVDSPGSTPDSTPPSSPISQHDSLNQSYSFSEVGRPQIGSQSSSLAGSNRSLSSLLDGPTSNKDHYKLKRQLAEAQNVVKALLQVDEVDDAACEKATKQVTVMRFEINKLRDGYKTARAEQEKLERRLEEIQSENSKREQKALASQTYEEQLEATLASMQALLSQRDADLKNLRLKLDEKKKSLENDQTERIQQLEKDLWEAKADAEELERERQLNVGEIASLTMQLRNAPRQQSAKASADSQDLEEARKRVEELEREREDRLTKEKQLILRLNETKSELQKYKDCDSGLDYVDRVDVLEKRIIDIQSTASRDLASKDLQIKKLNDLMQDLSNQSKKWESAASESSAQILKMASHVEEMQTYLAEVEIENHRVVRELDEAETRIAELEDKQWLRDQKLAGLTTLYERSERKLKDMESENDAMRSSFSNHEVSMTSIALSDIELRPSSDQNLKRKNRDLRRKVQELQSDLERSFLRLETMSKELQEYKAKEVNNREIIARLEQEKNRIEDALLEKEARVHSTEKWRSNDVSLALGFGAKEVATNTRILKLEQEKKSLERQLMELSEKQSMHVTLPVDEWDPFNVRTGSPSIKDKLEAELLIAKHEIEESQRALESERSARTADLNRMKKHLEESEAKVSELETRFARYLHPQDSSRDDQDTLELSQEGRNSELSLRELELQAQLAEKKEEIRIWQEKHAMQVDQVNGLRDRLTDVLTQLEDLEYERNFNEVKVMELTNMNTTLMQSDDDEIRRLLTDKAVQCADLATKLSQSEKVSAAYKTNIEKLEMECSLNKAKIAELSAIWESQAEDEKAKKAVIMKAMEVAEQLNEALHRIEELELENEESSAKVASLGIKLSNSVQIVDDLDKKLEAALREKSELEAKLMNSGVVMIGPDDKTPVRRPMFSFTGATFGEQLKTSEMTLSKIATPQPPVELLSGEL